MGCGCWSKGARLKRDDRGGWDGTSRGVVMGLCNFILCCPERERFSRNVVYRGRDEGGKSEGNMESNCSWICRLAPPSKPANLPSPHVP